MRYLHFSVGVFSIHHNPVLMRTYALGFFEGVFYSEYLHNSNYHTVTRTSRAPDVSLRRRKIHNDLLLVLFVSTFNQIQRQ